MLTSTTKLSVFAITAASLLSACGGGGSTTSTTPPAATFSSLIVVQEETSTQDSYIPNLINNVAPTNAATSLPGNNTTGSYAWNEAGANWWAGVGTDSVYKGIGAATAAGSGVGVFVQSAGSSSWDIDGATLMTVGLGTNAECVGTCKATMIIKSTIQNCIATANNPITILTGAVNSGRGATQVNGAIPIYSKALTEANWTVTGCTSNTMADFLTTPVNEIHAQLLEANMQFTTVDTGSGLYANGINLGAVKFD